MIDLMAMELLQGIYYGVYQLKDFQIVQLPSVRLHILP